MVKHYKHNKNIPLIGLSALLLGGIPAGPAQAQATFNCFQSLLFGNYTTCGATHAATISPTGTQSTAGCLSAGGAPVAAAQCFFSQTGFPTSTFVFSVTAASYKITNTATAAAKMTVDNFQCRFQGPTASSTKACNFSAPTLFLTIGIGADLTVANGQTAGSYSGTFTVNTNIP